MGRRRVELAPIPRHAVIPGKRVLDDPRLPGADGVRARSLEPPLLAPEVPGVRRQTPLVALECNHGSGGDACHRSKQDYANAAFLHGESGFQCEFMTVRTLAGVIDFKAPDLFPACRLKQVLSAEEALNPFAP